MRVSVKPGSHASHKWYWSKKADREDREAEREEELKHASDWMRKRIKNQREAERRADFWDRRKKCYGSPAGFFVNPSEEDKPAYMTAGAN